jgi:GNAT superfamily N-acetyltransferase
VKAIDASSLRVATAHDIPALKALMNASIPALLNPYLTPEQVEASFSVMGLDTQLIEDRTYFIVLAGKTVVGCGGWSRRSTLFGGDHSSGRDAAILDPKKDAARIRAMYTHPEFVRRGIGRLLLETCEREAAKEGFTRAGLVATLAGEPLYRASGYSELKRFHAETPSGVGVPMILMGKSLAMAR